MPCGDVRLLRLLSSRPQEPGRELVHRFCARLRLVLRILAEQLLHLMVQQRQEQHVHLVLQLLPWPALEAS